MKSFALLLLLLAPTMLFAKTFSYAPPGSVEIREAIIEVSSQTRMRSALLYGVLGQETAYGRNIGKTEEGWKSFCASRNTQDCQSWKTYDCKGEYRNARHFDDLLTQLGYLRADGKADRREIPVSSTCAVGLTQFEPNTWWGVFGTQNKQIYNPWNVHDAVYAAALYLRDLGADGNELLKAGEVIGSKDKIALQKYYCGLYYQRAECVAYALGVERQARRAEKTLLVRDLEQQIRELKLQKAQMLLGSKSTPSSSRVLPPAPQGETPLSPPPPVLVPTQKVSEQKPLPQPLPPTEPPVEIIPPLVIETTTLPAGVLREPYSVRFSAQGGKPPYRWSIEEAPNATLPKGLTLDAVAGVISGTPLVDSSTSLVFVVKDSVGQMAQQYMELKTTIPFMKSELRINDRDGITDYDPTIVKRKNGELVMVFVSYERAGQTGLFSMRSSDNGKTWTTPVFVYGQVYRSEIAEDGEGNIVLFAKGGGYDEGQLFTLLSRDGGRTWGEKRTVSLLLGGNINADSIISARDGYYYASYRVGFTETKFTEEIYVTRSKDLITWEAPVSIASDSPRGEEFPSALLEASDGELYLSYLSGKLNAVVIAASRDGVKWSNKRNIPLTGLLHLNPNGFLIGGAPVFLYAQGLASGITFFSHLSGAYWSDTLPFFVFSQGYFASDAVVLDDQTLAIVASDFSPERDIIFAKTSSVMPSQ